MGRFARPVRQVREVKMARWTLLVYRLPSEPSAPRVAVWRALQRLSGGYLQDGTYVAPQSDETDLELGILAHDIRNSSGHASILRIDEVDDEAHFKERLALGLKPLPAAKAAAQKSNNKKNHSKGATS